MYIFSPVPESPAIHDGDEWKSIWGFRYGVSDLKLKKPPDVTSGGVLTKRIFLPVVIFPALFALFLYSLGVFRYIKPVFAYEIDLPGSFSSWSDKGGGYYDFTYSESGWSFTGSIFKPTGSNPPGIVVSHGKGGSGTLFCGGTQMWFPSYMRVCPNYTHASSSAGGNDDASSWAGSPENVKRAAKALDILVSYEIEQKFSTSADPGRLFMWGNSMGAFVTVATSAQVGSRLKAAAYTAGGLSSGDYLPNDRTIASGVEAPFLMLHALNDGTVDPPSSRNWRDALISYDKTYQLVFFTSGGHNMMHDTTYQPVLGELMRAWFENPDPGLTSISPNFGQTGTAVTYTGTNFGANPGNLSSVTFTNNKLGSITSWAGTSVKANVPNGVVSGLTRVVVSQGPVTNSLISTSEPVTGGKRTNGIHFTVGNSPSNPPPTSSPTFLKGDVNHDRVVNGVDAKLILNNYAKNSSLVPNYFDAVVDSKVSGMDFGWVVKEWQ